MLNLPEYVGYSKEEKIALMDNSTLAFMHELSQKGFLVDRVLKDYDLILIPNWVMEEVEDSKYRCLYVEQLRTIGYPIFYINEINYACFIDYKDVDLYYVVEAVVSCVGELMRYIRRNVYKNDLFDLESSEEWIKRMYDEWPLPGRELSSGRFLKKNAGEISLTILAEIFSWFYNKINVITIFTQDADTYAFQANAEQKLIKNKNFSSKLKSFVPISFKSNDFILCQLYRDGFIDIENVFKIRQNARKIIYIKQQIDKSVVQCSKVFPTELFVNLIQDNTVQILF